KGDDVQIERRIILPDIQNLLDALQNTLFHSPPPLSAVLDCVVQMLAGIDGTDALLGRTVIDHQMNVPSHSQTGLRDDLAGLDDLSNLDLGLLAVAITNVLTLLERPDSLKHFQLDDPIAHGDVTAGSLAPPSSVTDVNDLRLDHRKQRCARLRDDIDSVVYSRMITPGICDN